MNGADMTFGGGVSIGHTGVPVGPLDVRGPAGADLRIGTNDVGNPIIAADGGSLELRPRLNGNAVSIFGAAGEANLQISPGIETWVQSLSMDGVTPSILNLNPATSAVRLWGPFEPLGTIRVPSPTEPVVVADGLRATGVFEPLGGMLVPGADPVVVNDDIRVNTLTIVGGADLVEGFESGDTACAPGTVVSIDPQHPGRLMPSDGAYDTKVAGVVSGAGGVAPGIRMGQESVMDGDTPVAMTGRVFVRCSDENGAIEPGDRLTTSSVPGVAMKATDTDRCDGAVLGKAMSRANEEGLVLVLVNLQ
ncbi:MAG: hypothetical protein AAF682_29590 [Planctomycetota bacterium]